MKTRKVMILLSVALSLILFVTGCEYDPSMYGNDLSVEKGASGVVTGTVLDYTKILAEPREDSEVIEAIVPGDVVIITGELENGYYPVEYDQYAFGYVLESCLEIHEPVAESEEVVENVITATVIDNINIRRGPGQDYELIERIGPGAVLTIVGEEENGYYPVDYNGEIGYAHHNFIQINEQPVNVESEANDAEEDVIDGPITIENNESFAEIMSLTDVFDPRIEQFVNSHIGDVIEFDGYVSNVANHGSFNTRYDFLVNVGNVGDPSVGPNFHYTDFSYAQMYFDNDTPDSVYANTEFHFVAEILSYNSATGLLELRPISTVYRGS